MHHINLDQISIFTFFAVYFAGIVTSLTPCVYPIIPIVVGYLGSIAGSPKRKFIAAVAYVLGLSLVYTALGMIASLSGSIFGQMTTNPYVYTGFGIILLILGGNMLDLYYIPMPGGVSGESKTVKDSFFWAPFFIGLTSGVVASPCTAPVLGTLLVYVAAKKDIVRGGLLMFSFSLGMSTLLLIIGFSSGMLSFLPKSGKWMVIIKKIMALIIIAAGIYFLYQAGLLAGLY